MAWEEFKRRDAIEGAGKPFISVTAQHFGFSAEFVRKAELGTHKRVNIHTDPKNLRLGFEFHTDKDRPNAFTLSYQSSAKRGEKRTGMQCTSRSVVNEFAWIKSITRLSVKDRRFEATKEGKLWVIQLCPAFEVRKARESEDIPSDARGIYRYLREGEIVYVGRGDIKKRLKSPDREDWDFDVIEYSLLEDPDEQVKWEDYWLSRYKEDHAGRLPIYNKISAPSEG